MTQMERYRKRAQSQAGQKSFFLSVLATSIMVFPLFFGKSGIDSHTKYKDNRRDTRHSIFVISGLDGKTMEEKQALENIYAWIDLKSPGKTMTAETPLGFKSFTGVHPKYSFTQSDAAFQNTVQQDEQQAIVPLSKPMIIGNERTLLTQPINEITPWKPFWEIKMPEIGKSEKPEGILWRSANGRLIANAPQIDEKTALDAWNKHAPSGVTSLECSQFMGKMPPRVVIRKSCGNSELDLLAAAALRRHLLSMPALNMMDNTIFKPFRTDVLWHLRN